MKRELPLVAVAEKRLASAERLFIGAYGFEERTLGWLNMVKPDTKIRQGFMFRYVNPKGKNRTAEVRKALERFGVKRPIEASYNLLAPQELEEGLFTRIDIDTFEEVVLDITAMTKLMIMIALNALKDFKGRVRLVYSEAETYSPDIKEYDENKRQMALSAKFPSTGVEQIIRLRFLSSIRMQGQPRTLVAFASFNEKLVSHCIEFISPHRFVLINGCPPRAEYKWREYATYDIHRRLCEKYPGDNPLNSEGILSRRCSTLEYSETIDTLAEVYAKYGGLERIICAATGSKMQTVGLYFSKLLYPDIQVEYPTPDSYLKSLSAGVRQVHEVVFESFADTLVRWVASKGPIRHHVTD